MKHGKGLILGMLAALVLCALPTDAFAKKAFDASEDFAHSEAISDKEMSQQRGGFLDINGMLVNFSFTGVASINGALVSQIQIDLADVINAANGNPSNFINPTIIQNVDNNALIVVQQAFNLEVSGAAGLINSQTQYGQAAFSGVMAIR